VTKTKASAGNAAVAGPQLTNDLLDGTGDEVQFTLKGTVQNEIGGALTGATVTANGGAVTCAEDGALGTYYCAVPNAGATDLSVSKTGYVTKTKATVGAAAEAGPQRTNDMLDGTGNEVLFTLKSTIQDELGGALTGATVTANGGAVTCAEEGALGIYYCAVPNAAATDITAAKSGYVTTTKATAGAAAEAGPQTTNNLLDGTGNEVKFTLKTAVQDELGNTLSGATVTANGGAIACTEDGGSATYYCAVPAGQPTDVRAAKDGYVTKTKATAGNASAASQTTNNLDDAGGNGVLFSLKTTIQNEIGIVLTGATVTANSGTIPCFEDGALGTYYCAVLNGTPTDVTAAKTGYITKTKATAGNAGNTTQTTNNLDDASGNGMLFTLKSTIQTEIGSILMGATVTANGGAIACSEDGSLGVYYCAVPNAGATDMQVAKTGYISKSVLTAGPAAEAGPQVTNDMLDAAANGVLYTLKSAVQDELGNTLTGATVSANSGTITCSEDGTTGTYYCPVANASPTDMRALKTGYVTMTKATAGAAAEAGPQITNNLTGADGLLFQIRVNGGATNLETEIGTALTLDGTETITVCTIATCASTEAPASSSYSAGSFYIAPATTGSKWIRILKTGFVRQIDTAGITAATTAQVSPKWTKTAGDGLMYTIKVNAVQDELGHALTLDGANDVVEVHGAANCADAAIPPEAAAEFDATTSAWYIRMADGTYYVEYQKDGYVYSCDASSLVVSGSGSQMIPSFVAGTDGLLFSLKVDVYDEFGQAQLSATVTHGAAAAAYVVGNAHYFNVDAAVTPTASLTISKAGFTTIGPGGNTVAPGGLGNGQTHIVLSGRHAPPVEIGTVNAAVPPGAYKAADGLRYANNVQLAVQYDEGAGPVWATGLGSLTNFYFTDAGGARVIPTTFVEIDPVGYPGVYQFHVDTSATNVQIKDVDYDGDQWADLIDSANIPLTDIDLTLKEFGTTTMYPRADYIEVTATTGTLTTGSTEILNVGVYDNNGNIITVGPDAGRRITLTLSGGSASPPSQKTITATNLANNTGTGGTSITGEVTAGVATVTITDTLVGDGTDITVAAQPATGSLPQNKALNTSALAIDVVSSAPAKIVILNPTDTTVDNLASVEVQVQDAQGNIIPTAANTFTINTGGNAIGTTVSTGVILGGTGNTNAVHVQAVGGKVVLNVQDHSPETIYITLTDDGTNGGLNLTSTQDLTFAVGAATKIRLDNPADTTVGLNTSVTASVLDQYDNLVTSQFNFTIIASGNAKFTGATTGTLVSGTGTNSASVRTSAIGIVTLTLTDNTSETVNLTLSDTSHTLLDVTSTQNVVFSPASANRIEIVPGDLTLTAGVVSGSYTLYIKDAYDNLVPQTSDLSVYMSSSSSGGSFYASAMPGAPTANPVTIPMGSASTFFYYRDTKAADSVTLTATAAPLTDTQVIKVTPSTPVTGYTVSDPRTKVSDSVQPTKFKCAQSVTISDSDGTRTITPLIEYPYTDSSSYTDKIVADGFTSGIIRIEVKDMYNNIIPGSSASPVTVMFTATLNGTATDAVVITQANDKVDSAGRAQVNITSRSAGDVSVSAQVIVDGITYNYGSAFHIYFKTNDKTPPAISALTSSSLVNGDYISPYGPIRIAAALTDTGVGVDTSSIAVTVIDVATGIAVTGSIDSISTNCNDPLNCTIVWNPAGTMAAGKYEVTLAVKDKNQNKQEQKWRVAVEGGGGMIKDLITGPGVFDPRSGSPMYITFQAAEDLVSVRLEIYNRSGRIVHQSLWTNLNAGYNNGITWDGRDNSGDFAGNGIYMFRLTATSATGHTTVQTGKLAVFKP